MKKYVIDDLRKGLWSIPITVKAESPQKALKQLGYKNIKRDNLGVGDIVVRSVKGSYVYNADT